MTMKITTVAALWFAAWLAPMTGNAAPINYMITISGGVTDCARFRPLDVSCDAVIVGNMLVDSEGATFAEQLLAFSLPVAPVLTLTLPDTLWAGARNSLQFDSSGTLTGFTLPLIFYRPDINQPDPLTRYAVRMAADAAGGWFAFEERGVSDSYNRCTGCVAISVDEPGASWMLIPAVALTLLMTRRRRTRFAATG